MGIKEEISEMFDALERTVEKTDPPSTDAPVDKEPLPKTNAPKTSPPATEPPKDGDDEGKTEPPSTDTPKDGELDRIKRENEELRTKLAEKVADRTKLPKTKHPTTDAPVVDEDFVKDVDLDEVTREPSAFNKLLNTIYKKAIQTVRGEARRTKEDTLRELPEMVTRKLETEKSLKEMSDKFYTKNKDLEPFKKVVGVVFEELASENPTLKYNEVLEKVGDETRKRLDLKKPIAEPPKKKDDDDPPPLPRKKGGRVVQPKNEPNLVTSQISDMNKALKR